MPRGGFMSQTETGQAWDVVARAKYEAEFGDHLE